MAEDLYYITTQLLLFITGLCVGSFLNVLSDRLSHDESILGRSHCDNCKNTLKWYELIPLFSFLLQKAKCRTCKISLSWYYPVVELVTGLAFILGWNFFPGQFFAQFSPAFGELLRLDFAWQVIVSKVLFLGIISAIIVMFFADLKYFIIPDAMQVVFGVCSLLLLVLVNPTAGFIGWRILSACVVMAPILLLYVITKGRGMGFGDVKLAANAGLLLGIKFGLAAFYIAFITGAIFGILLIVKNRFKLKLKHKVPFGPFILAGILASLYYFEQISAFISIVYGL